MNATRPAWTLPLVLSGLGAAALQSTLALGQASPLLLYLAAPLIVLALAMLLFMRGAQLKERLSGVLVFLAAYLGASWLLLLVTRLT